MEVLVGPSAFGIEPSYGRDAAQDSSRAAVASRIGLASRINATAAAEEDDDVSSESSSSIGTPSDDDREDENESSFNSSDEAESKFRGGGSGAGRSLASLNSLEENLPIKRGLSNYFAGKSKSFASLADVCTVRDLKKTENPLNKRRRLLIASKWAKKSFYSFANPKSMPLLALKEDDDDDDFHDDPQPEQRLRIHDEEEDHDDDNNSHDDDDDDHHHHRGLRYAKFHDKRFKSFKTRCFSLADLQEHSSLEDDDDDDDDD